MEGPEKFCQCHLQAKAPYTLLLLLLLLLSCFSCVLLCATPQTAARQAPPSLGFSRQEPWSGCHFLLQSMKVKSEREVAQSCPTLRDPTDCSPPGSSIHGIFQERALESGAVAFSGVAPSLMKFNHLSSCEPTHIAGWGI